MEIGPYLTSLAGWACAITFVMIVHKTVTRYEASLKEQKPADKQAKPATQDDHVHHGVPSHA